MDSGFYKQENGELQFAPYLSFPDGTSLHTDVPADRARGRHGWRWFPDRETAEAAQQPQEAEDGPVARWTEFQRACSSTPGIVMLLAALLAPENAAKGGPVLFGGLAVGLGQAAIGHGFATYIEAWQGAMAAGFIAPELVANIAKLATECDLPAEFVAALESAL